MPNPPPVEVAIVGNDANLQAALKQAEARVGSFGTRLESGAGKAVGAASGIKKLESNLAGLAITATGAEPHLAHIATTIAGLGAEGPIMVAALAGLAAVAVAWQLIGSSAREAAKAQDEAVASALDAAKLRDLGGHPRAEMGAEIVGRAGKVSERDRLQAEIDNGLSGRAAGVNRARILTLNKEINESTVAISEWGRQLEGSSRGVTAEAGPAAQKVESLADALERVGRGMDVGASITRAIDNARATGGIAGAAGAVDPENLIRIRRLDLKPTESSDPRGAATADAIEAAAGFSRAGQIAVASFGAMAEAAITGSGRMAAAVTGALQAVVANIGMKGGGLFGATPWGALAGVGIGIIGSLIGRHNTPAPVRVANVAELGKAIADAASQRPINIRNNFRMPDGTTIEQTETVLLNRESRDAVRRYTVSR